MTWIFLIAVLLPSYPPVKPHQNTGKHEAQAQLVSMVETSVKHSNEGADPKSNDEQKAPKWYSSIEWSNWFLVLIAAVTAYAVWKQAIETKRAAQVMERQVAATETSSEKQLRAYVLPDNAAITEGAMLNPPQPERANVPGVVMIIKNYGQTPAYKIGSVIRIAVIFRADEGTSLQPPPIPSQFSNSLGASGVFHKAIWFDRPLTPNEIADIAVGKRAIYVYGRIEYDDVFGKRHFTNFRLHYRGQFPPGPGAVLYFGETGNDAG